MYVAPFRPEAAKFPPAQNGMVVSCEATPVVVLGDAAAFSRDFCHVRSSAVDTLSPSLSVVLFDNQSISVRWPRRTTFVYVSKIDGM